MDRVAVSADGGGDQNRFVAEARIPYSATNVEQQEGWCLVSQTDIAMAEYIYQNCPVMQTAVGLKADAIQQGGLSVQIGTGEAKTFKTQDLFGKTLLNWVTSADRHWDVFGFFATVAMPPRPELKQLYSKLEDTFEDIKQQLFILPLDKVDVYHKLNVAGEHQWIVTEKPSAVGKVFGQFGMGRPIPNCFVFWKTPPDAQGRLRSKVMTLKDSWTWLQHMREAALTAAKKRATPSLVTEHHESKQDMTLGGHVPFENDCLPSQQPDSLGLRDKFIDRLVRFRNSYSQLEQAEINGCSAVLGSMMKEYEADVFGQSRVDLPPDKKLAKQVVPEGPGIELVKLEIHFEQQVLQLFGVPPGMIQSESTHGKMVSNENQLRTYDQSLAARKHELLVPLQIMLRVILTGVLRARFAVKYKPSLTDVIVLNTRIIVTMPGIPPLEKLDQYYLAGLLKPEAYVAYLSSIHGIPREHFEDRPKISQMDLLTNGKTTLEEMKAPTAASAPAKKQQGKKRKAAVAT